MDVGHPAHVHFFRNAIRILESQGHKVTVSASDKDVTIELLRAYGIPFVHRGRNVAGAFRKAVHMVPTTLRIARIAAERHAEITAGINNPYIAQAGRLLGVPSVIFDDTETAGLINVATFAFATVVCTPRRFARDLGRKQIKYDGFHELAYLHPSYFTPDPAVPKRLSPDGGPYIIARLVAWTASHDAVRERARLVDFLIDGGLDLISEFGRVFFVAEGPLPEELEPHRYPLPPQTVLDALAGSRAYLGDGATMATEAALLGKPSLYVAPFRFGSMQELEDRFRLLRSVTEPADAIAQLGDWLADPEVGAIWEARRGVLLDETIDVTALLVKLLSGGSRRLGRLRVRER